MIRLKAPIMRSKLFVPADRPALFSKALASEADAICFDLEDAVLPTNKQQARANLEELVRCNVRTEKTIMVRTNPVRSADFAEDLSSIISRAVSLIALPKIEDPSEIESASAALSALEKEHCLSEPLAILPTIESPRGLRLAHEIAESDRRVIGFQLGLADFFEDMGVQKPQEVVAHYVRFQLRLASAEAGISCFDSAFADFKNEQGFVEEASSARNLGFSGKSCIHPAQVAAANRIFSPQPEEIAEAAQILDAWREAAKDGVGAFAWNGRMIDGPFIRRAEAILQSAEGIRRLKENRKLT